MSQQPEEFRVGGGTSKPGDANDLDVATLPEDLLLLLFQPDSGTIVGEHTLFYVLAGAVLADLALDERVTATATAIGNVKVEAVAGRAPADEILRSTWDYVAGQPRWVQTVLPAIGPSLREPLLERLIARGDIRRNTRRVLRLFDRSVLVDGGSGRRSRLLGDVRHALVDGAEPSPRIAALAALVWASGTLPQFHRDIPWTSAVITRAQELERGNWGAGAVSEAIARTLTAIIAGTVIVAAAGLPRAG